eukprot:IDg19248t1
MVAAGMSLRNRNNDSRQKGLGAGSIGSQFGVKSRAEQRSRRVITLASILRGMHRKWERIILKLVT